ncbi:MAG: NAD-dependent DNA ligase LigA [Paludibacteraceae bacterium]|nr:NAD-dependent DNA ligase LigA [Paludibacteraceae bacterium]
METIEQKIEDLRKELHLANYNYYVLSQPTMSDYDFDQKLAELQKLENENPQFYDANSPTQRVGSDINKNFVQVAHKYPMLSLGNTYSEEDIREFYDRTQRFLNGESFEIVCELKFDGVSISLRYEKGKLVQALTRGDGEKGDDVTENVRTIQSIPLQLQGSGYPEDFEIRGEILMPWEVFESLNKEREAQEEPLFANPRNATSGTIKLQNSSIVAHRRLDGFLYYILTDEPLKDTHWDNLQEARKWGFKISDYTKKCTTIDEVFDFINYWDIERKKLPFATDGIVLKVNSLRQQKNLGYTAKTPRWAIAYKFQAEKARTRLNSVSFQVGRTGAITPVANLDSVLLSGTYVKRASLHNADIIQQLDLYIGDYVYVEKGGEIIPKITGVDKEARILLSDKVEFIKKCPICGTPLVRFEGEAAHYCPNEDYCPPQITGKIEHFASRKAMNIEGLGEETVQLLYDKNLIKNIADVYDLRALELSQLERLGAKSAKNLIRAIEESKNVPFERVLFALGIRYVGATVAKKLAFALKNIQTLMSADKDTLLAVDEIGERIAQSIIDYFAKPEHQEIIRRLTEKGVQMAVDESIFEAKGDALSGLSIVISGVFAKYSRDELKNMIEMNGGKNVGSISAKTSYVLAGENMGPAKLEKAQKLGIKIISEDEFLTMIGKE